MRRPATRLLVAAVVLSMCGVATVACPHRAHAEAEDLETAVKATYLTKFGDFVEWPAGAIGAGGFNLCVAGSAPFGEVLDRAVRGQAVQSHPIVLLRLADFSADAHCNLLFVTEPSSQGVARILALASGQPVLTVTDQQQAPQARGIINFIIRDGRVRFQIDRSAAAANHLGVSSKLLDLAVNAQD